MNHAGEKMTFSKCTAIDMGGGTNFHTKEITSPLHYTYYDM